MTEAVKTWIARQVRALREQRDWSQGDLARESGKKQSNISRIEDPDYGQMTLQTLFDLAAAFDLPLLVQFAEWPDWLNRMEDVSTEWLQRESFNQAELSTLSAQQYTVTGDQISRLMNLNWNAALVGTANIGQRLGQVFVPTGSIEVSGSIDISYEDLQLEQFPVQAWLAEKEIEAGHA
jgi:transcriptional regulator with XRE-family HTH domain